MVSKVKAESFFTINYFPKSKSRVEVSPKFLFIVLDSKYAHFSLLVSNDLKFFDHFLESPTTTRRDTFNIDAIASSHPLSFNTIFI